MAKILGLNEIKQRYQKVQTKRSIRIIHDQLVEIINTDQALRTEYQIGFPESPLKESKNIIFIKNSRELMKEGRDMSHCVGSYVDSARNGSNFFYKVLKPQRGTLQIVFNDNNFEIEQFKLKSNAEPSYASREVVRKWLNLN